MKQKLPGYNQAQKLIELYRRAGFNDQEIAEELVLLEELILAEIIHEVELGLDEEKKRELDQLSLNSSSPLKIAELLGLTQEDLSLKIEQKTQAFIDQLEQDLVLKK